MFRISLLLSFLLLIISSCDEGCGGAECWNGGQCFDGYCYCEYGWYGEHCESVDLCIIEPVECENDGYCLNGSCECVGWYNGDSCEIDILEAYEGTYGGYYSCRPFADYRFRVTSSIKDSVMNLTSLTDVITYRFEVTFVEARKFEIRRQSVASVSGDRVEAIGSGTFYETGDLELSIGFENLDENSYYECFFSTL